MKTKQILIIAFIALASVQIYIPLRMILGKESVIKNGKEYKFKTAPLDPNDPFRGKYVRLRFTNNTKIVMPNEIWNEQDVVFVSFLSDEEGFAEIKSVLKTVPENEDFYLKTTVSYVYDDGRIEIYYPFDRFYMEESKAPEAENVYWESLRDTSKTTYALVNIKNGDAVLKDVCIDGISITKLADSNEELSENTSKNDD